MDAPIQTTLLKKAYALLARRAYGRCELKNKLAGTASESQIESALNHLEHLNLLNDDDYAYNFALHRIRQQAWSPAKVQHALIRRRIDTPVIARAIDRVYAESGSETDIVVAYIRKHCGKKGLPTDPKAIRGLVLRLRQHGFEEEPIIGAMRRLFPADTMQRFETGE